MKEIGKVVAFGEIMLRLAPQGFLRFSQANSFDVIYGGGESNVAVSLANYGIPVDFITRLPNNDIGKCALMEMRKRGMNTEHVVFGGDRLSIYFLETGAVSRGSKVVYDRAHSAMSEIQKGMIDWNKVFEGAEWFHWTGITPAISQGAADACLEAVKVAHRNGITISTELNYRAKLWKYNGDREAIMTELTSYCDIILGNEEDAEIHFGIKPEGISVQTEGHNLKAESFLSKQFEQSENVSVYAKLPNWFKIDTPLGSYNPDWVVSWKDGNEEKLYFVVESKGSTSEMDLRPKEQSKIEKFFKNYSRFRVNFLSCKSIFDE